MVSKGINGLTIVIANHAALNLGTVISIWLFQELHIGDVRYYFHKAVFLMVDNMLLFR